MQQIAVERIGLQPLQRSLACGDGAAPRCVARQHLGDEIEIVALAARDRVRDHELGVAIHLRGIDVGHAELDATAQRRDSVSAVAAIDVPGALPDHGDFRPAAAEFFLLHVRLNFR